MVGIYAIVNKVNGRMYIGSSTNMKKRWSRHRCLLVKNEHHCKYLQNAWNKYGADSFEFQELELCEEQELLEAEQRWLDFTEDCYNINKSAFRPNEDVIVALTKASADRHNKSASARIHRLMLGYGVIKGHGDIKGRDSWDIIVEQFGDVELFDELWERAESDEYLF